LRHIPSPLINQELLPFLRDVHDNLAIILDTLAADRDRLGGVLDVYLSSLANRNAEATKTLTLLGTAALPALVISSIFGMNIDYPSWTKSHSMFAIVTIISLAVTLFLLWYLRREDYLPGGTTSGSTNT
jgi:magnesium transporter